ncbi:MAG: hypothetical protein B5M54_00915 [Candidatus Aminicenantes bacterium 4484_214]|nr:MAG: hypothetical protein B5M54_00915 [Candidatus Aminicenantes bacterium 4484_214]RLE08754.1 MAG: hypothetical protein DRJ06_04080 [Candidatus Aminicenantes bacterium]
MSLLSRIQGVFINPNETFKALNQRPKWIDALIIILVAFLIYGYLTTPYSLKDQANFMKDNLKLQERMGEERFNKTLADLENPSSSSIILRSFLLGPITLLVGLLLSSLIILIIGRFVSTEGNFKLIWSHYLHANFIDKIFGNGVRLFLILTKKSVVQTTTSLAAFFPQLEVTSTSYIILSQFDFFQLWMFGILSYGLASAFKIDFKKALFVSYGFWVIKSILYILLGILGGQFAS